MHYVKRLPLAAYLLLAACHAQSSNLADSGQDIPDGPPQEEAGKFLCVPGRPGSGVIISSSADVPAGGETKITVSSPPNLPMALAEDRARLHCQVDDAWCAGQSCAGAPPVDFYGHHVDGLSWSSKSISGSGVTTVYTMIAHNADVGVSHQVTLMLEMPSNWSPAPPTTTP